jgi:hypothetical protein
MNTENELESLRAELFIVRANWDAANRDALAAHKLACAVGLDRDAWQACAAALAADLRGCSQCCDVSTCVCRASLAEFERLQKL